MTTAIRRYRDLQDRNYERTQDRILAIDPSLPYRYAIDDAWYRTEPAMQQIIQRYSKTQKGLNHRKNQEDARERHRDGLHPYFDMWFCPACRELNKYLDDV